MQEVIDGKISLQEGQKEYRDFVMRSMDYFMSLEWFQAMVELIPRRVIAPFVQIIGFKPMLHSLMWQYWKVCEPGKV